MDEVSTDRKKYSLSCGLVSKFKPPAPPPRLSYFTLVSQFPQDDEEMQTWFGYVEGRSESGLIYVFADVNEY